MDEDFPVNCHSFVLRMTGAIEGNEYFQSGNEAHIHIGNWTILNEDWIEDKNKYLSSGVITCHFYLKITRRGGVDYSLVHSALVVPDSDSGELMLMHRSGINRLVETVSYEEIKNAYAYYAQHDGGDSVVEFRFVPNAES